MYSRALQNALRKRSYDKYQAKISEKEADVWFLGGDRLFYI